MKLNISIDLDNKYIYSEDENIGEKIREIMQEAIEEEIREQIMGDPHLQTLIQLTRDKALQGIYPVVEKQVKEILAKIPSLEKKDE